MDEQLLYYLLIGILALAAGLVLHYFFVKWKLDERADIKAKLSEFEGIKETLASTESKLDARESENHTLKDEKEVLSREKEQLSEAKGRLEIVKTKLDSELQNLRKYQEEQAQRDKELREQTKKEFEILSNKLFEAKTEKFSRLSKENLGQVVNPLKEDIEKFKKQVREAYDKENRERGRLGKHLDHLKDLNKQLSQDAQQLAEALKGQSKVQGDWGEMILETIMENSGLRKGGEYFTQNSFRDADKKLKRPDVIVKYPDSGFLIIDSKVSLNAYIDYSQADGEQEREAALKRHLLSIKKHIKDLSDKKYEDYPGSLDYVMLFVPIEPAYLLALQHEKELWQQAFEKRVILISPTQLLASLRLIKEIWKKEQHNANAQKIAERGELLLNKFLGFYETMEKVQYQLNKAVQSQSKAMDQLKSGRGNLVGHAKKLSKLGIKTKKNEKLKEISKFAEAEEE